MRYRITIVSLIAVVITTGFQILVSKASVNPSETMRDLTVNQSAGIGTVHYVDRNHSQEAQDGSSHSSRDGRKTFQVFLPFVSKSSLSDLPVFPGAEGFGVDTPAGRGGQVIRVTTLDDDGPGSFREALGAKGPKVIVFEVGGTIWSTRDWEIRDPFVTIAGQTAPSPGITLAGATLVIHTHDVLIQHLRIRVGDLAGPPLRDRDAIRIQGCRWHCDPPTEFYNIVIDHCSLSWAIDEAVGTWEDRDITVSHCIMSEGLDAGSMYSMGPLVGDHTTQYSLIGNLMAHNSRRNPFIKGGTTTVVVNNVIYNARWHWAHFGDLEDAGESFASIVGNIMMAGSDTQQGPAVAFSSNVTIGTKVYLEDNGIPGVPGDPWDIAVIYSPHTEASLRVDTPPVWWEGLTVRPSGEVLDWVLANAGARPWDRDAVDRRIVSDVRNGTGRIIYSQDDVGGWPALGETHHVLDLPDDPSGDDDGDGYTNLEEWLFGFGQMPSPTNTPSPTMTSTPLSTHTPTLTPTNTPTLTPTSTPTPTPIETPLPTFTPTATNTTLPIYTPTPTSTPLPTHTPTFAPTNTPPLTPISTPTPTPTETPLPTYTPAATNTPTSLPTNTPALTSTPTPPPTSPTATSTPSSMITPTNTPMPTNTPNPTATSTLLPTNTPTFAPTNTPTLTPTSTLTPTATNTPLPTYTSTPTSTSMPSPTSTPTSTSTSLPPTRQP